MKQQYQMLRGVSRTFALSIEQLPRELRDALTLAYLLLRVSDGLEDHPALDAARKAELLRLWERILAGEEEPRALREAIADLDPANPEVGVALRSEELLAELRALPAAVRERILHYVRQTTLGMARWQLQGPVVRTEEEMDDYMHQVAGLVGYLITDVFACHSPALRERRELLRPLAREFGLALQTVNVIRGLRSDYERGWVFVPDAFCRQVGLTPAQLFEPEHRERALQVVELLVRKAERHLGYGLRYIQALPRRLHRIRLMCMWPLLFAARTLAVSRGNPAVLLSEAKVSRREVKAIIRNTLLLGWSNRWLEWYYRQLHSSPEQKRPPTRGSKGAWGGGRGRSAQESHQLQTPTTSIR